MTVCTDDLYMCQIEVFVHAVPQYNSYALVASAARQPVSVAVQASSFAFQHYKGGVLTGESGTKIDHGVLLVGYGKDEFGGDFWKIKNSWGPYWGEHGFIRIQREMSWYASPVGSLLRQATPSKPTPILLNHVRPCSYPHLRAP